MDHGEDNFCHDIDNFNYCFVLVIVQVRWCTELTIILSTLKSTCTTPQTRDDKVMDPPYCDEQSSFTSFNY